VVLYSISMSFLEAPDRAKNSSDIQNISGVGPATAEKLHEAGIDTVDKIASASVAKLQAIGIQKHIAETVINNAQQRANGDEENYKPDGMRSPKAQQGEEDRIEAVMLNGKRVPVTDQNHKNAELAGYEDILEWMSMDEDTRKRIIRIENAKLPPERQQRVEPHGADDFELGTMEAPEFLKKRQQAEIKDQRAKRVQGAKIQKNTKNFAADMVRGEKMPEPSINTENAGEDQDTAIYIPNRKNKRKTQKQAKKEMESSANSVIENMLGR